MNYADRRTSRYLCFLSSGDGRAVDADHDVQAPAYILTLRSVWPVWSGTSVGFQKPNICTLVGLQFHCCPLVSGLPIWSAKESSVSSNMSFKYSRHRLTVCLSCGTTLENVTS